MNTNTTSMLRTLGSRAALVALLLLIPLACSEMTGVETPEAAITVIHQPAPQPVDGGDVYFSLADADAGVLSAIGDDGTAGTRWCTQLVSWIEPNARKCAGKREAPPYGEVTAVEGGVRVAAGNRFVAPFIWSAGPDRPEPFPMDEDFALDVELTVEQLAGKGMGLQVLRWIPAKTEGSNNPGSALPVLQIMADAANGLGVRLLSGATIKVPNPMEPHAYQLVYRDGEFSVFVDGELVAGPVASIRRPNTFWVGSPQITWWYGDWSDLLISEIKVSVLDDALEVPFDVRPASCPANVNRKARGVLPAAIMGAADLDVNEINPESIKLNGLAPVRHAFEDVGAPVEPRTDKTIDDCTAEGPDGTTDLTLKFDNEALAAVLAEGRAGDAWNLTLTGELLDGTPIVGEDVVVLLK